MMKKPPETGPPSLESGLFHELLPYKKRRPIGRLLNRHGGEFLPIVLRQQKATDIVLGELVGGAAAALAFVV